MKTIACHIHHNNFLQRTLYIMPDPMKEGILTFIPYIWILLIIPTVLGNTTQCYPEFDECFSNGYPWSSLTRPVPPPQDPQTVGTKIYCYTRGSTQRYNITLYSEILLNGCPFNSSRNTVFITHGFAQNGNVTWMGLMKDYYLKQVDVNVFLVDWGPGAEEYLQAVSNTRTVGAVVARFMKHLNSTFGLTPGQLHLIGFSLGAHAVAYASNGFPIANRITGLDPAQPFYEGEPIEVRLDPTDAIHVDVIHTSAEPFIPNLGFGHITPCGHVDFYMNKGGRKQPGCPIPSNDPTVDVTSSSFSQLFLQAIFCSHARSFMYFIYALGGNCTFLGHNTTYSEVQRMSRNYLPTILTREPDSDCTPDTCTPIGLDTFLYPIIARGVFIVNTTSSPPFCGNENITISI